MAKQKTNDGDKSLLAALKEITTTEDVAYYIAFKYAPEILEKDNIKTFVTQCQQQILPENRNFVFFFLMCLRIDKDDGRPLFGQQEPVRRFVGMSRLP